VVIRGACHCGNVSFELEGHADAAEISARACGCSFCVKHGGAWTSDHSGRLRVQVRDVAQLSTYAFGTRTADFHICRACGVVPVVTSLIDGRLYAVVNANAFDARDRARVKVAPASFEGEEGAARLERRKQSWIGDVRFEGVVESR